MTVDRRLRILLSAIRDNDGDTFADLWSTRLADKNELYDDRTDKFTHQYCTTKCVQLEKRGYITRVKKGQSHELHLTDSGKELLQKYLNFRYRDTL